MLRSQSGGRGLGVGRNSGRKTNRIASRNWQVIVDSEQRFSADQWHTQTVIVGSPDEVQLVVDSLRVGWSVGRWVDGLELIAVVVR